MDDTTGTLERPTRGFPPPSPGASAPARPTTAPAPWPGQISQAGPMLPVVAPQVPQPAAAPSNPFAEAMFAPATPPSAKQPRRRHPVRRGVTWLIALTVVGGLGYAGITYGPDLVDRVTDGSDSDGPAAPLVYPAAPTAPVAVRSATFTVSEPDAFGGTQQYEVTADFESGIAKVVVPRTDTPNLEILTLWDQAFIRRSDDATWYSLPRGDFPIDFSLGRSRWVRTLDELVPASMRSSITIDEATESSVGTDPARRLVVSATPAAFIPAPVTVADPTADGSPTPAAAPLPPGISVQPGAGGVDTLTMEIWVDDAGLVRKSVMPAELGGETITVTSVSPEAWEPAFPAPEVVQPLTAQALLHLGF